MLIVIAGLPLMGKTTLARLISQRLSATCLSVDAVDAALLRSAVTPLGLKGYEVCYRIAADNLSLGNAVVIDAETPTRATRSAWQLIAQQAGVDLLAVELVCSDPVERQQRAWQRHTRWLENPIAQWADMTRPKHDPWPEPHSILDTAGQTVDQSLAELLALLEESRVA